jgi:hypothetical protein
MKKIFAITTILMFCLSFLVIAGPDLTVMDLTIDADSIVPGEKYHYTIDVKNVGDVASTTRLAERHYFQGDYSLPSAASLVTQLGSRDKSEISPITIIDANGVESEVLPEDSEITYMSHEESEEQIQERIDGFMVRANSLDWTDEQIQEQTDEIQAMFGNPHEVTVDGLFITLGPGETARYDSADSYMEFGALAFPTTSLSNEPIPLTLTFELDPMLESDENINNNVYTKEILMEPNVIQGPAEETEKNRELDDENEYFAYSLGCTTIQSKEICVSGDDPNVPDEEEMLVISVDGVEQKYSFYGLMMSWINQLFGNGKLAATETVNGVEITLYDNGFKFVFV